MRRILMYFILAGSITVFAQLQLQDMATTSGASDDASVLAEQTENEPAEEATPAEGQSDSVEAKPDESNTSEKMPVSKDGEIESVNEETDETGDNQPSDEDFKPDEEISEDYPVSLPSDI